MTDRMQDPTIGINDFLKEASKIIDGEPVQLKMLSDQWFYIRVSGELMFEDSNTYTYLTTSRESHGTFDVEQTLYQLLDDWEQTVKLEKKKGKGSVAY